MIFCLIFVMAGPMGMFERAEFAHGTHAIMNALADLTRRGVITVVCGGETVAAVEQYFGPSSVLTTNASKDRTTEKYFTHVSTGGGAALEYLQGNVLPGVAALYESTE